MTDTEVWCKVKVVIKVNRKLLGTCYLISRLLKTNDLFLFGIGYCSSALLVPLDLNLDPFSRENETTAYYSVMKLWVLCYGFFGFRIQLNVIVSSYSPISYFFNDSGLSWGYLLPT